MNSPIAIGLAALVGLCGLIDMAFFGGSGAFFLARKTFLLIDWIAFWR
jgi:hypothetical protein